RQLAEGAGPEERPGVVTVQFLDAVNVSPRLHFLRLCESVGHSPGRLTLCVRRARQHTQEQHKGAIRRRLHAIVGNQSHLNNLERAQNASNRTPMPVGVSTAIMTPVRKALRGDFTQLSSMTVTFGGGTEWALRSENTKPHKAEMRASPAWTPR